MRQHITLWRTVNTASFSNQPQDASISSDQTTHDCVTSFKTLHYTRATCAKNVKPRNVEYNEALQVRQRNVFSITVHSDALVQVPVSPSEDLFTTEDTEPHQVLGAAPTLLWVFFTLLMKLKRDLGVKTDTKVVVHDALLIIVVSTTTSPVNQSHTHINNLTCQSISHTHTSTTSPVNQSHTLTCQSTSHSLTHTHQ